MRVSSARLNWVSKFKDVNDPHKSTVQVQKILPYLLSARKKKPAEKCKQHAAQCDTTYYIVDAITGVRKRWGVYEVRVSGLPFESGDDETWEPLKNMRGDMPDILRDILHTAGDETF